MRVMGIDPGSNKVGWAYLEDEEVSDFGVIMLPQKKHLSVRVMKLYTALGKVIYEFGNPAKVGVETPYVGRYPGAVVPLCHARGVILLRLELLGLPIVDINPMEAKAALGVTRKGDKGDVRSRVEKIYGIEGVSEDAADAIAIATATLTRGHDDLR